MPFYRFSFLSLYFYLISISSAESIDFNHEVRPILNLHCVACHGGVKQAGDVSFVYRDQAISTIEPGKPEESTLIERVTSDVPDEQMPPAEHGSRLNSEELSILKRWIEEGANWGEHWSFIAPKQSDAPTSDTVGWSKSKIDTFVFDQLRIANLVPSKEADPEKWLRRVSIDLIGLPPTLAERSDFLQMLKAAEDSGEKSSILKDKVYEKVVDRLLKTSSFGERWASVWLDVVRYADSKGLGQDGRRSVWKYRDWVIKAFNDDMPFDAFTVKQLAGDLMPERSLSDLVATACNRLTQTNEEGGTDDEQFRVEAVLDRVNTTWQTWQGLTFGCVQCHSHPYDPIRHEEYYQSFAFFNNTLDADLNSDAPNIEVPIKEEDSVRFHELNQKLETIELEDWKTTNSLLKDTSKWKAFDSISLESSNTTKLEVVENEGHQEFRTVGTVARDTKITIRSPLSNHPTHITALKLTCLPENEEKARLYSELGFVISYIEGKLIVPGGDSIPLSFVYVIGDEAYPVVNPQLSLNAKDPQGFGAFTRMNYRRCAAFVLKEPLLVPEGASIEIAIHQNVFDLDAFPLVAHRGRLEWSDSTVITEWWNSSDRKARHETAAKLRSELKNIPTVRTPVMHEIQDDLRRPSTRFDRGDFLSKSEEVEADTPDFLPPIVCDSSKPKNRLDFAKWLVDSRNPLTARVAVNRFWAQLFGIGLVETLEDFGSSGDVPSHPLLLDDLASRFRDEMKWSVKTLLKELVLSSTYRQDAYASKEVIEKDPRNRMLSRGPRVRLPAETVRDQALAISGLLNKQIYGPPTYPPLPEGVWNPFQGGDKWLTPTKGEPDRYRRTLYTYTKRTIPFPIMASFDAPSREACASRRLRSNTPLQALMTLNDTTFVEATEAFAIRMINQASDREEQIRRGFTEATCREPSPVELKELLSLFELSMQKESSQHEDGTPDIQRIEKQIQAERDAMSQVATVLLNLDEIFTN